MDYIRGQYVQLSLKYTTYQLFLYTTYTYKYLNYTYIIHNSRLCNKNIERFFISYKIKSNTPLAIFN